MLHTPNDDAEWPERFVYVCNSGSAMSVNLAPMLHAGRGRVAGLVMLVSLVSPNNPTGADKVHSIEPARRLQRAARQLLNLEDTHVRTINGSADLLMPWQDALNEARTFARELGVDQIVYNLTGGRKPCTIGALDGYVAEPGMSLSLISVGSDPFCVRLLRREDGRIVDERPLPVEDRLTLDQYLAAYGIDEVDPDARRRWQARCREVAPAVRPLLDWAKGATRDAAQAGIRALHEAVRPQRTVPCTLRVADTREQQRSAFAAALGRIEAAWRAAKLPGPEWTHQGGAISAVRIDDWDTLDLLGGKWLEAVIFERLCRFAEGRENLELAAGVRLAIDGKAEGGEIDLLMLRGDRLHLVEIKAVTVATGLHGDIAKLAARRNLLGGQQARAWLVAPLLDKDQVRAPKLREAAARENVDLLHGEGAVDMLLDRVGKALRLDRDF